MSVTGFLYMHPVFGWVSLTSLSGVISAASTDVFNVADITKKQLITTFLIISNGVAFLFFA